MIPVLRYFGWRILAVFRKKFLILFAVPLIFCWNTALAVDWSLTPSVTLSEQYDSNVRFSKGPVPNGSKSDFITNLIPVISVTGETEQTKFRFDTTTTAQAYVNNPHYDTINTDTKAVLTRQWTPRFSTDTNFGFIHDWTLEDQLQQAGIRTVRTERFRYDGGMGAKYAMSESWMLAVGGRAGQTDYPSGSLPNLLTAGGSITPVWAVNAKNNIGLSSSFDHADFKNTSTIDNFSEMLYWENLVNETTSFKLGAGYQFTTIDFKTRVPIFVIPGLPFYYFAEKPVTAHESSPVFIASLKKDWTERFSTNLMASAEEYNDANARSFQKTSFRGSARYLLSELTTLGFDAAYDFNTQTAQGDEQINYYSLTPSIQRNLSESFILTLAGSYEHQTDKDFGVVGTEASVERFRTWAQLTYKWPRFFASH